MNKRTLSLLISLVMLFSLTACAAEPVAEPAVAPAEQQQPEAEPIAQNKLVAINARINGKAEVEFSGAGSFLAQAVLPEGMAVDHWEINGVPADNQGRRYSLDFTVDTSALIEAVLRPELKVTSINAVMRFVNERGRPEGPVFNEFIFEKDYYNEATEEVNEGGLITLHVEADVPRNYEIDYWKINGVPYFFDREVEEFIVVNLDETTVYEVVLRHEDDDETDVNSLIPAPGTSGGPALPDDPPAPGGTPPADDLPFGVDEPDPEPTPMPKPEPDDDDDKKKDDKKKEEKPSAPSKPSDSDSKKDDDDDRPSRPSSPGSNENSGSDSNSNNNNNENSGSNGNSNNNNENSGSDGNSNNNNNENSGSNGNSNNNNNENSGSNGNSYALTTHNDTYQQIP